MPGMVPHSSRLASTGSLIAVGQVDARGRLAEVSCGEYITAALTQQGEVLTWGRTANGRSGTGRLATALTEPCALPRRAFGGVAVSSLALGWCAIGALAH